MPGGGRGFGGLARIASSVAVMAVLAAGSVAAAADPTSPPPRLTCDQRFPANGPAGVDLRLGCLVGEVVGTFTGATDQGDPAPLSSYLEPLVLVGLGLAGMVVALVLTRRALGHRLAPVAPSEWWSCGACRSLNPGSASRCYSCGAPRPAGPDPAAGTGVNA
ncbi:MAG TPA: Ran-binding zinc finger domain-containing protein [Candidatus Limnocylindrales bacterium]|nr:Ran-binding zinc finger domain-containing protein [Candidatus Limnocylindrales bacterium]